MRPSDLHTALLSLTAPAGAHLVLPVDSGSSLDVEVSDRLNRVAALVSTDGQLTIYGAEFELTTTGVRVIGSADALGFRAVDCSWQIGPGDDTELTLSATDDRPLRYHADLGWHAFELKLFAAQGASDVHATLTGTLDIAGQQSDVSLADVTLTNLVPGSETVLDLVLPTGVTANLSVIAALEGSALRLAADTVPKLAGASGVNQLQLLTSGPTPGLAAEQPINQHLEIWPQHVEVDATTVRARAFAPTDTDDFGGGTIELTGAVTVLGTTEPAAVIMTHSPAGLVSRVAVTPDPTQLTVTTLLSTFFGPAQDRLSVLPDGLKGYVESSGFTTLAVITGPESGAVAFEGSGSFLGAPAHARLGFRPGITGEEVAVWIRLDGQPKSVIALLADVGLDVPAVIAAHTPTVQLALREFHYDPRDYLADIGGTIAGTNWKLDLRLGLGYPGGVRFVAGDLYGTDHHPNASAPELVELFDALVPGAEHSKLMADLASVVPAKLNQIVTGTTIHHAELTWFPAAATHPSFFGASLVCSVPAASGPLVSTLDISHTGGLGAQSSQWSVRIHSPFLRLDLVELIGEFGLPVDELGVDSGDLQVVLHDVVVTDHGIEVTVELDVGETEAMLTARAEKQSGGMAWDLNLTVGGYTFDLAVEPGPPKLMKATLLTGDRGARLADLASLLNLTDFPDYLDFTLDEVDLVFEPDAGGLGLRARVHVGSTSIEPEVVTVRGDDDPPTRIFAMQVTLGQVHVGLDQIPVIGGSIPFGGQLGVDFEDLKALYLGDDVTPAELIALNVLAPTELEPTSSPVTKGLEFGGTIKVGTANVSIGDDAAIVPVPPSAGGPPAAVPVAPVAPPDHAVDVLKWTAVDKALGPLHVAMVGIGHHEGHVVLGVTGSLELAVLELTLIGLRVDVPIGALTDPSQLREARFAIDGVGLQLHMPSVTLGGALVHSGDRLDGAAILSTSGLTLKLLASLTTVGSGETSIFMYGVLDKPIGGPAYFFVTGLAVGFGYNRDLVLPPVEQVPDFLMVKAAMGGATPVDSIGDMISLLEAPATQVAFPPRAGAGFGAIGIKFTSFKLIESFLLLTVAIGPTTRISLLGISSVQLPPKPPPGQAAAGAIASQVPPLAEANIALKATYDIDRGRLEIEGQLVGSYILSKKCMLTGGFAVLAHFKDDTITPGRAGDFVVTMGGYHPHYAAPAWYPPAPRLGLWWRISPHLEVKGGAYFALTPGAAMAGGALRATWDKGRLSAEFTMAADFLIEWEPYHYEVEVGLGVHGTLDVLWGFSGTVYADLHLYGPPFGGTATLELGPFTRTVTFGSGRPPKLPVPIEAFAEKFLPTPAETCSASLSSGALGHDPASDIWMVAPATVEIVINSVVPATHLYSGESAIDAVERGATPASRAMPALGAELNNSLSVVPSAVQATTPMAYSVGKKNASGAYDDVTVHFEADVETKAQPSALWNPGSGPRAAHSETHQGIAGVTLRPRAVVKGRVSRLSFEDLGTELLNDGFDPPPIMLATQVPVSDRRHGPKNQHGLLLETLVQAGFDLHHHVPRDLEQPPSAIGVRTLMVDQ